MAPSPIETRASDNLRFIRATMERASSFTAVPGWGGVAMGVTALGAAGFSLLARTPQQWLGVWLAEAFLAFSIGLNATVRKARRGQTPLFSGPARRFFLTLSPPMAAGALLTLALERTGHVELLPGVWLLLYGTAVVTGGARALHAVGRRRARFASDLGNGLPRRGLRRIADRLRVPRRATARRMRW